MSNKKALKKFKNSLEFDFKIKVKLERKELPEHILNEVEENNNYLEEIIQDMIENAIGEYCEKCGDAITYCGDGDGDQWIGSTHPEVEITTD